MKHSTRRVSLQQVIFCLILLLFVPQPSLKGQSRGPEIHRKTVLLPVTDSRPLRATIWDIPYDLYTTDFSSTSNKLLLIFRKYSTMNLQYADKGAVAYYDVEHDTLLWTAPTTNFREIFDEKTLYLTGNSSTECIDITSGKTNWTNPNRLFWSGPQGEGLTYEGYFVNLSSGKENTQKACGQKYEPEDYLCVGDSLLLMASEGLSGITLRSHHCWFIKEQSSYTNKAGIGVNTAVAFLITGATVAAGGMIIPNTHITGSPNYIWNISSNILVDSGRVYHASLTKLLCASLEGRITWETPLEATNAGTSLLLPYRDQLLYINKGTASSDAGPVIISEPAVSFISKQSGKITTTLDLRCNKDGIIDYSLSGDTLLLLCSTQLIEVNLSLMSIRNRVRFDDTGNWRATEFVNDKHAYRKVDHRFIQLNQDTDDIKYIRGSQGLILSTNSSGSHMEIIVPSKLVVGYAIDSTYTFIVGSDSSGIVNKEGLLIHKLPIRGGCMYAGSSLFLVNKKTLTELKKEELLKLVE